MAPWQWKLICNHLITQTVIHSYCVALTTESKVMPVVGVQGQTLAANRPYGAAR